MPTESEGRYRINAIFPESEWLTLDKLARDQGKSKSEVIRNAIALEKWFQAAQAEGSRILVETGKGYIKELVPR